MFQNPLKPQGWDKSDPFNNMGSINDNQLIDSNNFHNTPFTNSQFNETLHTGNDESHLVDSNHESSTGVHFVNPHEVSDYYRQDGTHVDGYWRDGDGDTTVDLTTDQGGGYSQTNPDGDLTNNFG